ncbi:unnamed protein product [Mytilus edulis]|uniref:BEN domain-containing protein n=1 Tax=Mytilus edulis TaxID=6550 RepID=A0A8S3VIN5_MYTED|nr:unnamed protein product [Mytilus edulis]
MASTRQYALVLFDLHGETSIVQTQKLVPTSLVKEASRLHLQTSRNKYLVEVLELSDDDISLKSSQSKWSKSHRAIAIERRTGQDGFLDVWPEDEESATERQEKSSKQPLTTRKQANNRASVKPRKPKKSMQTSSSDSNSNRFPYASEGSNGRHLTILHEGSGDNTEARVAPQRKPLYLQDLSTDEADLVNLQIANTSKNLISIGVQTDTVVFISSDEEAAAFHQWQLGKTSSTGAIITQTSLPELISSSQQTEDLDKTLTSPKEVSTKGNRQLYPMSPQITIVNEKATKQHQDDTNATNKDTGLIDILYDHDDITTTTTQDIPIASIDDSLDILLATTTQDNNMNNIATPDKTQQKLDKIISLLQKNPEPRPSLDFVSALLQEANPDDIVIIQPSEAEEQNQPTITQFYPPCPPVNDQQPPTVLDELTFNIDTPDIPDDQPSVNNLTSTIPTSQSAHKTLKPCFTGNILELSSASDLLTMSSNQHTELRVGMTAMWEVQADSCSAGNFAWRLAKKLYTADQLNGKNYSGKKGKPALSPRRKHAIEHAIIDCYGPNPENLTQGMIAINTGIRNMCRKTTKSAA